MSTDPNPGPLVLEATTVPQSKLSIQRFNVAIACVVNIETCGFDLSAQEMVC